MTTKFAFLLRRAYEHLVASVGAIALTALLLVSVDARAATTRSLTPSVTVLVPTVTVLVPSVTIEALN
jgi:hypothetical protein